MMTRIARLMSLTTCLLLAAYAVAGEDDARPTKKTIAADDGLNLVCKIRGKGDTALVFLHGWCGDGEYWKNQVDVFAPDYRVITMDQAGHPGQLCDAGRPRDAIEKH